MASGGRTGGSSAGCGGLHQHPPAATAPDVGAAEPDREQGKLSPKDWARVDAELRREAIEILKELDRVRAERKGGSQGE